MTWVRARLINPNQKIQSLATRFNEALVIVAVAPPLADLADWHWTAATSTLRGLHEFFELDI